MFNKRHLRKFLSHDWKPNPQNGLLHTEKIEYVIRSTVQNIDHTRVLILYVYSVKLLKQGDFCPEYTVFQSKKDYITYEQVEDKKPHWRVCPFRSLLPEYYRSLRNLSAFYTKTDELRTIRFCDKMSENGYEALSGLQNRIFYQKCEVRRKARAKKRRDRMKGIGNIPKSVETWVRSDIVPTHGFYTYAKHRKEQLVYCTHCKTETMMSGVRHAKQGVCPNCGRTMTFHALGRTARVSDRFTVQFVEKAGEDYLLRVLKGDISYSPDYRSPKFCLWENARIFFREKEGGMETEPYYYSYSYPDYPWRNGFRPVIFHWSYYFDADLCGHLYTRNLDKVFAGSPWQYSQAERFYSADREPLELIPYLKAYRKYPVIEYLVRARLYHLTADFVYHSGGGYGTSRCINTDGKNMREVLRVSPAYLPIMQMCDIHMATLSLMQKLIANGLSVTGELLSWCQENKLHDSEKITRILRHTTAHKMMRYLTEQHEAVKNTVVPIGVRPYSEMSNVLVSYADYIDFCEQLNYDMTNSFVLFPAHLKEAHDNTSKLFNEQKARIWNACITEAYPALTEQYRFEKADLLICAPRSSDEIVHEGQVLHHCVNGYVERVAKHQTTILFLRKKEEPDKPYYTIEVKQNMVYQIRGDHNCGTTEKIDRFMDAWKTAKLLPPEQAA